MTILDLILGVFCAFRLTQLVVYDRISEPAVSWIASKHPKLDELLSCAHCSGFWCAVFTFLVIHAAKIWWPLTGVLWSFAIAGAVSMIEHGTCWLDPTTKVARVILDTSEPRSPHDF